MSCFPGLIKRQLKNVDVIVVIMVPRHNTVVQRRERKERFFLLSHSLLWINTHTNTYAYTLIFVVYF